MKTQTIDITKLRKGTVVDNGRKVQPCPICGKKGIVIKYTNHPGLNFCYHSLKITSTPFGLLPEPQQQCNLKQLNSKE